MNPTIHGSEALRAPALGLVAFALLIPSASMAGVETFSPAGGAAAAVAPEVIYLAQGEPGALPDERPVSYTSDQADRGEERYVKDCQECHGKDLKGGLNGGAPLRGLAFEEKFADGAPASAMFLFMSTLMPPNSPGRYSEHTYADLMAYILKRNGFKKGTPLPADVDALDYLIVEK